MDIFHFTANKHFQQLDAVDKLPEAGVLWLDFVRDDATGWEQEVQRLIGVTVEQQHITDSHNAAHPSFYDGTPDYDMLIFQGLGPESEPIPVDTRTAVFFLFDRLIVSVRASDNISFGLCKDKLREGRSRIPNSPLGVMHLVLDTMIDRYLAIREPLTRRLTQIQDDLLDPDNASDDWKQVLLDRRSLRRLDMLCSNQLDALDSLRRNTRVTWTQQQTVRMRDLEEHISRVYNHVTGLQRDMESAIQLHFSAVAHGTNKVVNRLTVISAVFLPLSLMAGIWGMNFETMPELGIPNAYYFALGAMASVGAMLLLFFKRRGFF